MPDQEFFEEKKQAALDTLREWYQTGFVILDTETTDRVDNGGEAIQISVIDQAGIVLMDQLIKPKGKISEGARAVHHISDEMLADKPTFDQIYGQLCAMLVGRLVVAYNEVFDRNILLNTCNLYGLDMLECRWGCAMLLYADYRGEWNSKFGNMAWAKLTYAMRELGLEARDAHNALGDVQMTRLMLEKMREKIKKNQLELY